MPPVDGLQRHLPEPTTITALFGVARFGRRQVSVIRHQRSPTKCSHPDRRDGTSCRHPPAPGFPIATSEFCPAASTDRHPGGRDIDISSSTSTIRRGARLGTVDADVLQQWDAFGIHSTALPHHPRRMGGRRRCPARRPDLSTSSVPGAAGLAPHIRLCLAVRKPDIVQTPTPLGDIRLPSTFIPVGTSHPRRVLQPLQRREAGYSVGGCRLLEGNAPSGEVLCVLPLGTSVSAEERPPSAWSPSQLTASCLAQRRCWS